MTEKTQAHISRLVVKAGKSDLAYEVQFEFPQGTTPEEFETARRRGIEAIRGWLREKEPVDLADVERLPWKGYQTKALIEPGHTGWIFWEKDRGAELAKAIRESPEQKLKLGPYEFVLRETRNSS